MTMTPFFQSTLYYTDGRTQTESQRFSGDKGAPNQILCCYVVAASLIKELIYLVLLSGMMFPERSTSSNRTKLTPSASGTMSGVKERSRALKVFRFMHLTNFGKYSLWSITSFTSTS